MRKTVNVFQSQEKLSSSDRQFMKFIQWINDNTDERTQAIIYVASVFGRAWDTLHVDPLWGNKANEFDLHQLKRVQESLKLLGLEHLLEMPKDDEDGVIEIVDFS